MKELLFHDEYTGPRWTYGGLLRPLSAFNLPSGTRIIIGSQRSDSRFPRFGVIDLANQLTDREVEQASLILVEP